MFWIKFRTQVLSSFYKIIEQMSKKHFNTICSKDAGVEASGNPHVLPIMPTSSFQYANIQDQIDVFSGKEKGFVYSRYNNPMIEAVAQKLARLETHGSELNARAYLTSSGMSAIHVLLQSVLRSGDGLLTQADLYGGTTELLNKVMSRAGISYHIGELSSPDYLENILEKHPEIRCLFLESPTNPMLRCTDIRNVCKWAKEHGLITIVDNTFSTPYLQQPLLLGADFVIHSTTKYISGHGFSTGGVIIGRDIAFMENEVWTILKLGGAVISPFEAWLISQGLRTLPLRMDRQCENALALAAYCQSHEKIRKVYYPGLESHDSHTIASQQMKQYGAMVTIDTGDDYAGTLRFINALKLGSIASTLGDLDTLILHPASSSHLNIDPEVRKAAGISDGLVRISVGIEHIDDLIGDVEQALLIL
jgi:methionine-gamma-lyase